MILAPFRAALLASVSWLPYLAIVTPLRPEPARRVYSTSSAMTSPLGWAS